MRILLCGSTGFIGTEVIEQCLKHNYIEKVYCLTRKELPKKYSTHKKVVQVIHTDFQQYPDHLLDKLSAWRIEGCIWCLGGRTMASFKNKEEAETIGIHYPILAANAFAMRLATKLDPDIHPNKQKFPFRFIFMSGWGAEQDQFRSLWMWNDSRKIKGAAEKGLFDLADNSELNKGKRCLEVIALRPGTVMTGGEATGTLLAEAVVPCIAVDRLAKCAIKMALEGTGYEGKRIMENKDCLGNDWGMINSLNI